mgnify:CR=1 FL=1|jgi:hypothetical protein
MADGLSFAILGGYGQLGRGVAALLLDRGADRVTIAGRSLEKAGKAAKDLAGRDCAGHVVSERADADDVDALADLLSSHDVVIHAAPLDSVAPRTMCEALAWAGGRLVLVSHGTDAIAGLQAARPRLEQAGAKMVVDTGADPGLPGLVGHLAAENHGAAEGVEIAARYRAPEVGRAGLADILDGGTEAAWVYADGWRRAGLFEVRRRAWPGGLGASLAIPIYLPELDALRARHNLQGLTLWHGGLNHIADAIVSLRRFMGTFLPKKIALAAIEASMRYTNRPPYGLSIVGVARGGGRTVRVALSHNDVYAATAEIVIWCAERLALDHQRKSSFCFAFELLNDANPIQGLRESGFNVMIKPSMNA